LVYFEIACRLLWAGFFVRRERDGISNTAVGVSDRKDSMKTFQVFRTWKV